MLRIVVPAREKSSRLPGKLLERIGGRTVVGHAIERVREAQDLLNVPSSLVLATDSEAIRRAAGNVDVEMTSAECPTGSDRVAAVAEQRGYGLGDIVVNVQADMPFIDPAHLARFLRQADTSRGWEILTAYTLMRVVECYTAPFSRKGVFSHIGLYAFTRPALRKFAELPQSVGELNTSLEQARAQEAGFAIGFVDLPAMPLEVNTHQDLAQIRQMMKAAV